MRAWLLKKHINPPIFFSILTALALGFIFGIFATGRFQKIDLALSYQVGPKAKQFLLTFTQNYWFFFIIWLAGLIPFGFIIVYFILFFRSFMFGVTFGLILKAEALFGTYSFFKLLLWHFIINLPLLIFLAHRVLIISFTTIPRNAHNKPKVNPVTYVNTLLLVTVGLVIFSILVALSSTTVAT